MHLSRINPGIIIVSFFVLIFFGLCSNAEARDQEPLAESRSSIADRRIQMCRGLICSGAFSRILRGTWRDVEERFCPAK
jgi:hypothetical protein